MGIALIVVGSLSAGAAIGFMAFALCAISRQAEDRERAKRG